MNLKWKLLLIILSIAIIPPLTIAIQIGTQFSSRTESSHSFFILTQLITKHLTKAVETNDYTVFQNLPPDSQLAIFDTEGRLIFSGRGKRDIETIDVTGSSPATFTFKVLGHSEQLEVQLTIPSSIFLEADRPLLVLPITLLSLLVFVILVSIYIMRSLGSSIKKLEDATTKIAAGNLDFQAEDLMKGDLATVGKSFIHMKNQLIEDRERRDRFIMGVSHDLKTPLAVIQGYLEAMEDGLADDAEKKANYIHIMRTKASLLEARIAQLIELAQTTTHDWRRSLTESDLGLFLENTLSSLSEYCASKSVSLEKMIQLPKPCPLQFDVVMLERVLENLVENALRYGSPERPILISAKQEDVGSEITLCVENEGPGISDSSLEKIFEPFFRGDKSRNDGGFGLGLASVKSIVESHGWNIHAESEADGHTTFIIRIPR